MKQLERFDLVKKDIAPIGFTYLVIFLILLSIGLFRGLSTMEIRSAPPIAIDPPGYLKSQ